MGKQLPMTRERFSEILKEYSYTDKQIELLWDSKPAGDLDEEGVRKTARHFATKKDLLIQA